MSLTFWDFLNHTLTASVVALLLLAVKRLLADKLSPRWQYGIWVVFALRLLLPVKRGRYVLIDLALPIELLKGELEPTAVTDWLLIVYFAGAGLFLLRHLLSYLRLRRLLDRGRRADLATLDGLRAVCSKYALKPPSRVVLVDGLPSAFVCGVLRPVLALPGERYTDEKVLLHELLHLRYQDALQSVLWCILRALHWCNPFLHYVFNRIGNDMEALCDQRVLERLEGEQRREYGEILLGMASRSYPRAVGTSSVSNGAANISRRIESIARFKLYPGGMALVSVCVALVLLLPLLWGTRSSYGIELFRPYTASRLPLSMAMARLNRCSTVAGALDTYVKGIVLENGVYLAVASPLSGHAALEEKMDREPPAYHIGQSLGGTDINAYSWENGYGVYNLRRAGEGQYTATIALSLTSFFNEDGSLWYDENGRASGGCLLIPVSVSDEDGWVVRETGERTAYVGTLNDLSYAEVTPLPMRRLTATGKTGKVVVTETTLYTMSNTQSGDWLFFGFDETPRPHDDFDYVKRDYSTCYTPTPNENGELPRRNVSFEVVALSSPDEVYEWPANRMNSGDYSSSSNDGYHSAGRGIGTSWDGTISGGGGGGGDYDGVIMELPAAYRVRLYWDDELVEELTITEVTG